jgi:CheY-like chemotaxis protein
MRDYGAQAHGVSSVADALQVLGEGTFRPDIVVSDLGLPDADGYEFIRRIRATPELGKLPAIAVTAYANPEDRIRALAAGYQTHLPKPVDLAVLAASIAALLPSKPRSTAQSGPSESRLREAGGERPLKPSET